MYVKILEQTHFGIDYKPVGNKAPLDFMLAELMSQKDMFILKTSQIKPVNCVALHSGESQIVARVHLIVNIYLTYRTSRQEDWTPQNPYM